MRPRYGRVAVLGASLSVTGIALLGSVGVLPSVASGGPGEGATADPGSSRAGSVAGPAADASASDAATQQASVKGAAQLAAEPSTNAAATKASEPPTPRPQEEAQDPPVPAGSGEGRRIVFDQSDQRVWLVDEDGTVERTYLVSGSLYDNLDPGTYSVYSRSEQAWGVDDSGTMKYFVRFTQGDNGAAIGFHDIPVDDGELVQTLDQLGTPQSHGCIRQKPADAVALWNFAPIGTEVDVTA